MEKMLKKILLASLFLFPLMVFASEDGNTIFGIIFVEAFVSIHMSIFVLKPLSQIFSKTNSNKLFWKLFWIRVIILLFFDFFITPAIVIVDFLGVFVGAFLLVPICKFIFNKKEININLDETSTTNSEITELDDIKKCEKCNYLIKNGDKFCENCGQEIKAVEKNIGKVAVKTQNFDAIYRYTEEKMVNEFILRELKKIGIDENNTLIPKSVENRKKVLNIIFSMLVFIYISLIFFHFPIMVYIIGLVILLIFFRLTRKFDLIKYLVKELKSRPSEKISNVVMSIKQTLKVNESKKVLTLGVCIAVILPLIIFFKPHIMYEKMENGYGVRFYTFGITNFTKAVIPEEYNGKKVVSLRGSTFSNMFLLKEVILPNTITEIRGQAFYNTRSLEKVNMPTSLEYLGGGAFYNSTKITELELPETLTFIGGEAFYNAKSLEIINLPSGIEEIRGNTFENCKSLVSINIPDNVRRIGGHAFYGCSSLVSVTISPNSKLNQIGSSAFRMCDSLYSIYLPSGVYVNERAFKESPTSIKYYGDSDYYYNY